MLTTAILVLLVSGSTPTAPHMPRGSLSRYSRDGVEEGASRSFPGFAVACLYGDGVDDMMVLLMIASGGPRGECARHPAPQGAGEGGGPGRRVGCHPRPAGTVRDPEVNQLADSWSCRADSAWEEAEVMVSSMQLTCGLGLLPAVRRWCRVRRWRGRA